MKNCVSVKHFISICIKIRFVSYRLQWNSSISYPRLVKGFKKIKKSFSKRILFKKIVIMRGKAEFFKIMGIIWSISIEAGNIYNIVLRPAICNGLTVIKLKSILNIGVMYIKNQFVFTFVRSSRLFEISQYIIWKHFYFKSSLKGGKNQVFWYFWNSRRKLQCYWKNHFRWDRNNW